MSMTYDVVIIGAGAAGLMCAATAGYRGQRVLVLDHANKAGKKILMSGGGRCNFTNLNTTPQHFLSTNPHFCISALKRYGPQQFVELVDRHGLEYEEKAPGQLFCQHRSQDVLDVLLTECEWAGVEIRLNTQIKQLVRHGDGMRLQTSQGRLDVGAVVVATGGLSIPTLGASGFGYELARQFDLEVLPTRAGLVPFTLHPELKQHLASLSGVSVPVSVSCREQAFQEPMLFTHRGLSGPAMLQISSYWQPGDGVHVNLLPGASVLEALKAFRQAHPKASLMRFLTERLPKRLAQTLCDWHQWHQGHIADFSNAQLAEIEAQLCDWRVTPAGTEGYRTAEVTLGGVDTRQISSRTFAVEGLPQLRFIGEVLDVTGQLGGFNFQWAWASGVACGESF